MLIWGKNHIRCAMKKGESVFRVFTFWGFLVCKSVIVPQQLPFPLSSSATHASSGSNTHHHVTHTILNHTHKHKHTHNILLISSQIQGLLRPYFITHTRHLQNEQQHRVTEALHCIFFFFDISFSVSGPFSLRIFSLHIMKRPVDIIEAWNTWISSLSTTKVSVILNVCPSTEPFI